MTNPAVTLKWAGGKHRFNLATKWAVMMFEGIGRHAEVLQRFETNTYSASDVREVLRIGLIGGGTSISEAQHLIQTHVDGKPLAANALTAYAVLTALFVGADAAEKIVKPEAA